jgi:hypothetical protein
MSDIKLAAARELIREKQYAAARAVLQTIPDDFTAMEWLQKLDEIAPTHRSRRWLWTLLVVIVIVGIVGFGLNLRQQQIAAAESATAWVRTIGYCVRYMPDVDNRTCQDIVTTGDTNLQCHRASPVLDAPYYDCLNAELWGR